jgi:type I phosphodiesterase/nucleotide pyrophosphatase
MSARSFLSAAGFGPRALRPAGLHRLSSLDGDGACDRPLLSAFADDDKKVRHALLLSVDGFHAVDLEICIKTGNCPNLEKLMDHGFTYANASITKPSDSFPGLLAQITGGTSKSTGVFYDDSYDRTLFLPATASKPPAPCASGPGRRVMLAENTEFDKISIAGGVPASLTALNAAIAVDPNNLPGQKVSGICKPYGRIILFAPTPSLACSTSTSFGRLGRISTRPMTSSTATTRIRSRATRRAPMLTISSRPRSIQI